MQIIFGIIIIMVIVYFVVNRLKADKGIKDLVGNKNFVDITDGILNSVPICPKCQFPMILRKLTKGKKAGTEFYGCPNCPNFKEIK